jgi:hypothetical protein
MFSPCVITAIVDFLLGLIGSNVCPLPCARTAVTGSLNAPSTDTFHHKAVRSSKLPVPAPITITTQIFELETKKEVKKPISVFQDTVPFLSTPDTVDKRTLKSI